MERGHTSSHPSWKKQNKLKTKKSPKTIISLNKENNDEEFSVIVRTRITGSMSLTRS